MEQLGENLKAYDLRLDDAVMDQIDTVYHQNPDPTKQCKRRVNV
jgi:aryl-alcohol dehydrogenase-like predicted oxidoreductase